MAQRANIFVDWWMTMRFAAQRAAILIYFLQDTGPLGRVQFGAGNCYKDISPLGHGSQLRLIIYQMSMLEKGQNCKGQKAMLIHPLQIILNYVAKNYTLNKKS